MSESTSRTFVADPPAISHEALRRRWPALVLGLIVGAAGAWGALSLLGDEEGAADGTETNQLVLGTAPVEIRDLVDDVEWSGDLTYGDPATLTATADGTITGSSASGTTLERGDTIAAIDRIPVVLLYGAMPAYRDMAYGDTGPDILALEANLVMLGFDPDLTVTVDDTYTANTAAMVERWQLSLGLEETGDVKLGSVAFADGPVVITDTPAVGSAIRVGESIGLVSAQSIATVLLSGGAGTVTNPLAEGEIVATGTVLYGLDGVDVVAIEESLREADPIARFLSDPDRDPIDLEAALVFAGFASTVTLTVDGVLDEHTEVAIAVWQTANGLPPTGSYETHNYVVVPTGFRTTASYLSDTAEVLTGRPVFLLGAPTISVSVPVDVSEEDEFTIGEPVQIELADERVLEGTVAAIGTAAEVNADENPTIEVTIGIDALPEEAVAAGPVVVIAAGSRVDGALVVPTRALVSLIEGGYAVEVVSSNGDPVLVSVGDLGTFDDGYVEVSTDQLKSGDALVVPQ